MRRMAEAEAAGESFWTEAFNERVRTRIGHRWDRVVDSTGVDPGTVFGWARAMMLEQEGESYLVGEGLSPYSDFDMAFRSGPDELYPTVVEALLLASKNWDEAHAYGPYGTKGIPYRVADEINEVFAEERVAWEIIDLQMVEKRSTELHAEVVEPALRLLHDGRFADVDAVYRKALDELSRGDGADAITDAGTALQEMLTELGCEGNALGPLIKSARNKGLLAAHDSPLLDSVVAAMNWVAADRSEKGESHHASDASREDAWLIVHIVGAFIVRLAAGEAR
jgi:hypothetical protein